jgi:hypothetical protein
MGKNVGRRFQGRFRLTKAQQRFGRIDALVNNAGSDTNNIGRSLDELWTSFRPELGCIVPFDRISQPQFNFPGEIFQTLPRHSSGPSSKDTLSRSDYLQKSPQALSAKTSAKE